MVAQTEPPATCKVQVQFFDSNSNLVKSQTVYLTPGQSTKVSLSRGDLGARLQPHPLFWAQAALVNNCGNNANCDYTLCNINADGEEQGQDDEGASTNNTNLLIGNLFQSARVF